MGQHNLGSGATFQVGSKAVMWMVTCLHPLAFSHVVSHRAALVDLYSGYVSLVTNLMWFMTMLLMAKISIVDMVRMVQDKQRVMLMMKKLYLSPVRVNKMVVVGTFQIYGRWSIQLCSQRPGSTLQGLGQEVQHARGLDEWE